MNAQLTMMGGQMIEAVPAEPKDEEVRLRVISPQRSDRHLSAVPETATWMLYPTADGNFSVCYTDNQSSVDPAVVSAHLNRAWSTMGFRIGYAVNHATGEVIEVMKKGKFAQRDVKQWIDHGFTEWFYSLAFATKWFRLPNRQVVKLARKVDVSPRDTTREAFRWRGLI